MISFATHIEYLLMTQHYCFVPGLGGFMLQEQDAAIKADGTILSPTRIVQFNRFISHDDGMLAGVIMQSRHISYDEAVASIQMEVAAILSKAQHDGRCALGHLGIVFFDEDCHIAFRPADIQQFDPMNYGLESHRIKPWAQIEKEMKEAAERKAEKADVQDKPATPIVELKPAAKEGVVAIPTRWIRRVAIVLLIIGFFFASRIPMSDTSIQQAGMMNIPTLETPNANPAPAIIPATAAEEPSSAPIPEPESAVAENPSATEEPAPAKAENIAPTTAISTPTSAGLASQLQANELGLVYYIIIGSCTSDEDAQKFITKKEKKGYSDLGYINCDGRYRIFITYFGKLADAQSYVESLRSVEGFAKAWIHQAPLSLNIKNKDNDQLPMELSHLNKPAERDKG